MKLFSLKFYQTILPTLYYRVKFTLFKKNVLLGRGIVFIGFPYLKIISSAKLVIGDNVTINSSNLNYHVNMFGPTKLFADRRDAKIEIGSNTRIHGTCLHAYNQITIGKNCLIAANCQIIDGSGHDLSLQNPENRIKTIGNAKAVVIEDNVWIGANCIILPGTHVGEGSVVAAGSVLSGDYPSRVVIRGNPATIFEKS